MTKKVYKCSSYYKTLYGMMIIGILILGFWAMLYGIDKRVYNLPLLVIDLIFCIYSIFILARFFLYKVVMTDQFIKIYDVNKTTCIYYQNIIDIKVSKNICYIVDRIACDGSYFIRGTNAAAHYSKCGSIGINAHKIPSIKGAYIEGYSEIVETLLLKCGMDSANEAAFSGMRDNPPSSTVMPLLLLKSCDVKQLCFKEVLEVLAPYILLMLTFLLSLLFFGTVQKGFYHSWMIIFLKTVLLLYAIAAVYTLKARCIPLFKRFLESKYEKNCIGLKNIILFLLTNTLLSAAVIMLFLFITQKYS